MAIKHCRIVEFFQIKHLQTQPQKINMKTNSQGRANTKGLSNFLSTFPTFTSTSRQTNEQTRSQIPDSNPGPDLRNYVPNNEQVLIPMLVPDPE